MDAYSKGIQYELFIKKYLLTKYKQVYLWNDISAELFIETGLCKSYNERRQFLIKRKNLLRDTGIDILFYDGEEWVIVQCKNYENKTVCQSDLSGFFKFLYTTQLRGIVYHTSKISRILLEHTTPKHKYIYRPFNNSGEVKKIIQPYKHQTEAYSKIKNKNRTILHMPCGTGKTLVSTMYAKKYDIIIIFSPLRAFAQQNLNKFKEQLKNHTYYLIDSDENRDVAYMKNIISEKRKIILSSTYKSADIIYELLDVLHDKNVCVVIDEFHNLSVANISSYSDYLYQIFIRPFRFLFVSATPRIYGLDPLTISNEIVTGDIGYSYKFREAIKDGIICDYEVYVPDITCKPDNYLEKIYIELDCIANEYDSKINFLMKCMYEHGTRKCIVYLRSHKECAEFEKRVKNLNRYYNEELTIATIISSVNNKERKQILEDFSICIGKFILLSVRILDECIDIIECDSVFISYECKSKITMIQRMSRANRKDTNNPDKKSRIYLWCEEYSEITNFISSLKEFDDEFNVSKVKIISYFNSGKLLQNNIVERKKLDDYLINVKRVYSWQESSELLFDYADTNNRVPGKNDQHKNYKVGVWYNFQKQKIKDKTDAIYRKLSVNIIVKKGLDSHLENLNKIIVSFQEDTVKIKNRHFTTKNIKLLKEKYGIEIINKTHIKFKDVKKYLFNDNTIETPNNEDNIIKNGTTYITCIRCIEILEKYATKSVLCELRWLFQCDKCAEYFTTNQNLTKHLNKKMSCIKLHLKCDICNHVYKDKKSLQTHLNSSKHKNNLNNNNISNNIGNIKINEQQTTVLLNYSDMAIMDKLDETEYIRLFSKQSPENIISAIIEKTHFNKDLPKGQNIQCLNIGTSRGKVYHNNAWSTANIKNISNELKYYLVPFIFRIFEKIKNNLPKEKTEDMTKYINKLKHISINNTTMSPKEIAKHEKEITTKILHAIYDGTKELGLNRK